MLNLTHFIDDVSAGCEGTQPPPWSPKGPFGRGGQTLRLLRRWIRWQGDGKERSDRVRRIPALRVLEEAWKVVA